MQADRNGDATDSENEMLDAAGILCRSL